MFTFSCSEENSNRFCIKATYAGFKGYVDISFDKLINTDDVISACLMAKEDCMKAMELKIIDYTKYWAKLNE